MSEPPRSLVLIAHGSLAEGNPNQPMFELADRIFASGNFSTVTPAFLNGHPSITNVLDGLPPGDVVIVPMMTSEGYYLAALPEKLQQNCAAGDIRFFVTRVVGVHPAIADLISHRISSFLNQYQLSKSQTTVAVVGHGTRRNKNSCQATLRLTDKLAQRNPGLQFVSAFLDQAPTAAETAANIATANTMVVPFLISRGPHATVDIPEAFGLESGPEVVFPILRHTDNGICGCDLPVGLYPELAEICLQLALEELSQGVALEIETIAGGFGA